MPVASSEGIDQRYLVISADCHGGGSIDAYVEYLDPAFRQEFEDWRGAYKNPFRDLQGNSRTRNWDSERRFADLETDGQVAEVVFPNTVPPFFPTGMLVARPPGPEDLDRRWPACGPTTGGSPTGAPSTRRGGPGSPRCS